MAMRITHSPRAIQTGRKGQVMLENYVQAVQTPLTRREREVVVLTSAGLTSKEVALQIALAPRTVERHLENARHKMGARNRAHLIVKASEAGVL